MEESAVSLIVEAVLAGQRCETLTRFMGWWSRLKVLKIC
jgi:hypothetical protein